MTPDRDGGNAADGSSDDTEDAQEAREARESEDEDPFERLADADADAEDRNPFESLPAADADREEDPFEEVEGDPLSEVETDASEGGEVAEAIVPKSRYCESCEYFDEPPEIRCTHPGTEIRELVDMEHFRVFDCPIVASRQEVSEIVARDIEATLGGNDDGADGN